MQNAALGLTPDFARGSMKILVVNGTYRPKASTFQLVEKALEGARAEGAETEHVLLAKKKIRYCTNCLTCYKDLESSMAPCPIKDDVRGILEAIRRADGLILASPVHGGLATALMFAFLERALFVLARSTGASMGMRGCPEPRLTNKAGVAATIVSAGCATAELRHTCDMVTPLLAWYGSCFINGLPIADLYAAACFSGEMKANDWPRAFVLRRLTDAQLQEAYDLGVNMARTIRAGGLKPYSPAFFEPPPPG